MNIIREIKSFAKELKCIVYKITDPNRKNEKYEGIEFKNFVYVTLKNEEVPEGFIKTLRDLEEDTEENEELIKKHWESLDNLVIERANIEFSKIDILLEKLRPEVKEELFNV